MNLLKQSMAASAGVWTAAALVVAPVVTSVTYPAQAGEVAVPSQEDSQEPSQQGAALKGLLRPLRLQSDKQPEDMPQGPKAGHATDRHELEELYRPRLSQSDLDAREKAFGEITIEASLRPAARAALESISTDLGNPDLAFTARLALREVDGRARAAARGLFRPQGQAFSVDPFEAMQQRMEEMLQRDPFIHDFFAGDPFAADPFFSRGGNSLFRRRPGVLGSRGAAAVDPFDAMRKRTEEIRKQIEELHVSNSPAPRGGARALSSSSSMSVQATSDGVRVEITEQGPGGPTTRIYEAPSMDALLEANPELKGRVR
ncbi:MAG: hypothetical protein ACJA2W_000095 [Planctomycetota bacterium]|jgi:hypothetical protein